MKACIDREEALLLDVYGELGEEEKAEWARHLEQCSGCREERRKMLRFLGRIRTEMPAPSWSHEKAGALSRAIKRGLPDGEKGSRWWERMFPSRTLAALAAACCVFVLTGWLALKWFEGPSPEEPRTADRMTSEDIEIIKNLEILEDLETLRKLVQIVDHADANSESSEI